MEWRKDNVNEESGTHGKSKRKVLKEVKTKMDENKNANGNEKRK